MVQQHVRRDVRELHQFFIGFPGWGGLGVFASKRADLVVNQAIKQLRLFASNRAALTHIAAAELGKIWGILNLRAVFVH